MNFRTTLILALILISSGCIHANNQPNQNENETTSPTGNQPLSESDTIYLTDSGFEPSNLVIEEGETVTWTNNASNSMWIASDRHPTHTEYSGTSLRNHCQNGDQNSQAFDQCSTGDRFSFTFEKTGEWSYHNHEPFISGGVITVK